MSVSASAVVARARGDVGRTYFPGGYCLMHCDTWFGRPGSKGSGAGKYQNAIDVWNYGTGRHAGSYNVPAGAPVVFGKSPTRTDSNAPKGDVAISIGGGLIVATDATGNMVGIMTIAARAKQTQRPYLGWLDNWLGNPITGLSSISGAGTGSTVVLNPKVVKTVKAQQKRLNVWGATTPVLTLDGIPGTRFTQATRIFQKAHNLKVDGVIGATTWAKLSKKPPKAKSIVGPTALKAVQSKLGLTADGIKGPKTVAAIKAYKKAWGGMLVTASVSDKLKRTLGI